MAKNKSKGDKEIIKDIDTLTSVKINLDGAESAILYIRKAEPHSPPWTNIFSDHVDKKVFGNSSSPGAVLVIQLRQAKFMITFGLGRHSVRDAFIQRDYGLKVALNSIGEDKLRSIDKSSHERTPLNSRTQASKGVDIFELALNTEIDLLTAITGSSNIEKFGAKVTGRDALTLSVKENLEGFCELLKETYKVYKKKDYKKSFGWVDNFRRIKDPALLKKLDLKVLKLLKGDPVDSCCQLAEPEVIDWEYTAFYVLEKKGKRTDYYRELRLENLIQVIKSKNTNFTIDDFRSHSIYCTDDNYTVIKSWSAYNCLYAEINENNNWYILQNGSWFNVEDNFVSKVNAAISKIDNNYSLPIYDHKDEGDYNKYVSTQDGYVLMDRRNVTHGGGEKQY